MTKETTLGRVSGGWKPALALILLAPMVGELLTSSAPPLVFFIPWVFVLFALLYGCGALLIREMAVRWRSGWPGVLLMGGAYGILEEGLGAKSFFDPQWRALGPLGSHGRWMGVNWVWTLGLILFHSGFCMALSILAASLPFPELRRERWLGRGWLTVVAVLYFLVLLLFFQKGNENHYRAPTAYYLLCVGVAAALILAARLGPRRDQGAAMFSTVPPSYFAWTGFAAATAFVLILYVFPGTGASPWVTASLLFGLAALVAVLLRRWSAATERTLTRRQEAFLVAGAFGSFAVQAPLQEWNPARSSMATGMTGVGIACGIYLWWLCGRVRLAEARVSQEEIDGR